MTKYLPLSLAILLTVTAFIGLMVLLVQSTDESTKAQIDYHKGSHLMNVSN